MFNSWSILSVKKGPGVIDDDVRKALIIQACEMSLSKSEVHRFSTDVCEGYLETEWKHCMVGTKGGILFKTQVDAESGTYYVNFIINEDDLGEGEEVLRRIKDGRLSIGNKRRRGMIPVPDLYRFLDERTLN